MVALFIFSNCVIIIWLAINVIAGIIIMRINQTQDSSGEERSYSASQGETFFEGGWMSHFGDFLVHSDGKKKRSPRETYVLYQEPKRVKSRTDSRLEVSRKICFLESDSDDQSYEQHEKGPLNILN